MFPGFFRLTIDCSALVRCSTGHSRPIKGPRRERRRRASSRRRHADARQSNGSKYSNARQRRHHFGAIAPRHEAKAVLSDINESEPPLQTSSRRIVHCSTICASVARLSTHVLTKSNGTVSPRRSQLA